MTHTDTAGYATLESIRNAQHFNFWMYATIKKFLTGNILEIGSGIGNISFFLLEDKFDLTLSDIDSEYLKILRNQFCNYPNAKGFFKIDLECKSFEKEYADKEGKFDTIFLLNVLEHIKDDYKAIENCRYLLKPQGTLIILVPAYKFLYSELDKQLGHYRRYTSKSLSSLFSPERFTTETLFHFNSLGVAAWLWNKVFNKSGITKSRMLLYNKLVPIAKFLDVITFKRTGLSVIAVARKTIL